MRRAIVSSRTSHEDFSPSRSHVCTWDGFSCIAQSSRHVSSRVVIFPVASCSHVVMTVS